MFFDLRLGDVFSRRGDCERDAGGGAHDLEARDCEMLVRKAATESVDLFGCRE